MTQSTRILTTFWNLQGRFDMSDDIVRGCVTISVFAAGLTSFISGITHLQMDVHWIVPFIELFQSIIEVGLWFYAQKTGRYRTVFLLQLCAAFLGMSLAQLLGGSDFLTNSFWIALISPFCMVSGYRKMGSVLFVSSFLQLGAYYWLHGSEFSGQQNIFMLDAVLFTTAIVAIVTAVKVWAEDLQIKLMETEVSVQELQKDKHKHLLEMNHELRNPLAAMVASIGSLQELQQKDQLSAHVSNSDSARPIIETLHASASHMLAVLNDVLEIDRMATGISKPLDQASFSIRQLVQEVSRMFTAMAHGSSNLIKIRFAEGLTDQWIGPSKQIRQVLINLIANSIKHASGSLIQLSVLEISGFLVCQISDGGRGLSNDAMNVFNGSGTELSHENSFGGLGLKICKLIVEKQIGGTIQVQSNQKNGTVFVVKLPLSKCTEVLPTASPSYVFNQPINAVQDGVSGNTLIGKRLLFAEDDQHLGKALASAFEMAGFKVTLVSTSQDAMDAIEAGQTFDLALIDYDLGVCSRKDGIGLVQDLQHAGITAITGHTATYSQRLHERWREAGARAIVCKPAKTVEIIRTMESCYAAVTGQT